VCSSDLDNWEWPRHTGDFSIFRVNTAPDGKATEYNENNILTLCGETPTSLLNSVSNYMQEIIDFQKNHLNKFHGNFHEYYYF
jgi:hypothetical protein